MTQREQGIPAFVLHRRSFRETSVLLDVLTVGHGRMGLVARGVRGRRSRGASELEPFVPLRLSWTRRGELGSLTAFESTNSAIPLTGQALWCGFYANELVLRLLHRDEPNDQAFSCYAGVLADLLGGDEAVALRRFEWQILCASGYGFDPALQANGSPVLPASSYCWSQGAGICACKPNDQGAVSGTSLLALAGDLPEQTGARALLADALGDQLGGKPLRSGQILRQMRQIAETTGSGLSSE